MECSTGEFRRFCLQWLNQEEVCTGAGQEGEQRDWGYYLFLSSLNSLLFLKLLLWISITPSPESFQDT